MVVAYSSDTINKVKKLLLEGYSYTEISEKMGVSTAKISEVKNKFESELGKIDFETIREFSKIIKKNNISWSDLFSGNIITSYIKKLGIDLSTFESFVKNFYNECDKNNLESQKIIQYGEKLFLLEHQSGMSLEDLPEECHNLINEKESLEKEINQLNQDSEKSRNNTRTVLDENNQTLEKLNGFIKSKNILEKIKRLRRKPVPFPGHTIQPIKFINCFKGGGYPRFHPFALRFADISFCAVPKCRKQRMLVVYES